MLQRHCLRCLRILSCMEGHFKFTIKLTFGLKISNILNINTKNKRSNSCSQIDWKGRRRKSPPCITYKANLYIITQTQVPTSCAFKTPPHHNALWRNACIALQISYPRFHQEQSFPARNPQPRHNTVKVLKKTCSWIKNWNN